MRTATKRRADGSVSYYAYAWTGGPLIASGSGKTLDAARADLEKALSRPDTIARLAAAQEARSHRPAPSPAYISGLVLAFLKSPEFSRLAATTQRDYRRHLEEFRAEFGDWRTALFEDPRVAQDLAEWRDGATGARTGDMRISVASRLFGWARSRGFTNARPAEALERVHSADRSDMIWEEKPLTKLLAEASPCLQWAVRMAVLTGLRQGDLIRLPWSAVSDVAIQVRTSKRKRPVIIPITADLRALLAEIPRKGPVVLTSSTGRPWTGDGLRTAFQRARKDAKITGLRWHDFRGTAVTRLAKSNLRARDIALILGWSEARVEAIMARYVSAEAIALDMLARMGGEQKLQTGLQTGPSPETGKPPNS
jgi:integrase